MKDSFDRTIDYVRIAVTDRCNLRCFYCMPSEGIPYEPKAHLLSYEEITRLLKVLGKLGFQKVRFSWHHPNPGNFCVVNTSTTQIIKCWQHSSKGEFMHDFQASESNSFALREAQGETDLSQTSITVSWVFKSSKRPKSSWKLF